LYHKGDNSHFNLFLSEGHRLKPLPDSTLVKVEYPHFEGGDELEEKKKATLALTFEGQVRAGQVGSRPVNHV